MTLSSRVGRLPSPPLVPGFPLLGHALAMRKDLVPFLVEQYQRFGPIFRIRALKEEFVVLAGPEANSFVTQAGADLFCSRDLWYDYGREFGAENHLSALDGPIHSEMRKLFKPAYSVGNLLADIPLLVDIAQRVLSQLEIGEEVSVRSLFRKIVTAQLGQATISHTPGPRDAQRGGEEFNSE